MHDRDKGMNTERFFYHSFPRPRDTADGVAKGIEILKSIAKNGLLLVPEVIRFQDPTGQGPRFTTTAVQRRISFTELARSELAQHSQVFGPFALEYEIGTLRRMGAMPIWYVPEVQDRSSPEAAGCSLLARLADACSLVSDLLATLQMTGPGMTIELTTHDGQTAGLEVDDRGRAAIQHYIRLLFGRSGVAPAEMRNALTAIGSLIYPTENLQYTGELGYYRQREWRLIGGMYLGGQPLATEVTPAQYEELLAIDHEFFTHQVEMADGRWERGHKCHYLSRVNGQHVLELAHSVVAPKEAVAEVEQCLRDADLRCLVLSSETF